jgi:hypothetical protein
MMLLSLSFLHNQFSPINTYGHSNKMAKLKVENSAQTTLRLDQKYFKTKRPSMSEIVIPEEITEMRQD